MGDRDKHGEQSLYVRLMAAAASGDHPMSTNALLREAAANLSTPSATLPMPVRSTHSTLKEAARLLERWNWTSAASDVRRGMEVIPDLPMIGRVHKAPLTEIAPTPEGLAGMVRNQQDAGADLLRAAHAAVKAEGTPLAEEVPLVRRLHDQRDRCAALLRECLAGVVTDCTDWNRRAREALKDIPDAEQQLRNIAAAMRDDGPSKP